jgi:hypothetical protein
MLVVSSGHIYAGQIAVNVKSEAAAQKAHESLFSEIVKVIPSFEKDPNAIGEYGGSKVTALSLVALDAKRFGGMAMLKSILLREGINVNTFEPPLGFTALMRAAEKGEMAIAVELINAGALVNPKTSSGYTPLLVAVQAGQDAMVTLLLNYKAHIHAVTSEATGHETVLTLASARAKAETMLKLLVNAKAYVNHPNADGQTPLMIAADNGFAENVKYLLSVGAKADLYDDQGLTAFLLAASQNAMGSRQPIIDLLSPRTKYSHEHKQFTHFLKYHGDNKSSAQKKRMESALFILNGDTPPEGEFPGFFD